MPIHHCVWLPILCPKCGSHRTKTVGKPIDSALRVVRCHHCGITSSVLVPEDDAFEQAELIAV